MCKYLGKIIYKQQGLDISFSPYILRKEKYMYSVLIINSDNICDYIYNSADGIRYNDVSQEELDFLLKISLKYNYSVVVQKNDEEVR